MSRENKADENQTKPYTVSANTAVYGGLIVAVGGLGLGGMLGYHLGGPKNTLDQALEKIQPVHMFQSVAGIPEGAGTPIATRELRKDECAYKSPGHYPVLLTDLAAPDKVHKIGSYPVVSFVFCNVGDPKLKLEAAELDRLGRETTLHLRQAFAAKTIELGATAVTVTIVKDGLGLDGPDPNKNVSPQ